MNYTLETVLFAILLLAGMVGFLEIGRRIGIRRVAVDAEGVREGAGAVEGAVFGLLGLLLAFTFSGAASRFDERRHLIVEEANAIGTAYLRLDLLPAEEQPPLRDLFRSYLDSRLAAYRKLPDVKAAMTELNHSAQLQREIWTRAMAASKGEAKRLIEQGGVKINGEKASAANAEVGIDAEETLFQVGKRKFLRVRGQ